MVQTIQKIVGGVDMQGLSLTLNHEGEIASGDGRRIEELIEIVDLHPVHTDDAVSCLQPQISGQTVLGDVDPLYRLDRQDILTIIPGHAGIDDKGQNAIEDHSCQDDDDPLPHRFTSELILFRLLFDEIGVHTLVDHYGDLDIPSKRGCAKYILCLTFFEPEDFRRKADRELFYPHTEELGGKKVPQLMEIDKSKNNCRKDNLSAQQTQLPTNYRTYLVRHNLSIHSYFVLQSYSSIMYMFHTFCIQ